MRTENVLMCIVVVAFIFYMLTNSKQIGLEGACACTQKNKKCTCGKEAFYEALEASDSDSFSEGASDESFYEGSDDDSFSEGSDSDFA